MLDELNLNSGYEDSYADSLEADESTDNIADVDNVEESEVESEVEPKKRGRGRPKKDKPPKEPKKRGRPPKAPVIPEPDVAFDTLKGLLSEIQRDAEVIKLPISDIEIPDWKSESRVDSRGGLKESIESMGLLTPIAVFYDEALEQELEEIMELDEDIADEAQPKIYTLLDGYRRVLALQALGIEEVECYLWRLNAESEYDLSDKLFILLYLLALILNKTQRRTVKELYSLTQLFESNNLKLDTAELLLNMEAGTALQLKDVMTAEDFDDIREKLLNGDLTIEAAYKKLTSARKKAEKERLAAERGDVDDAEESPKKKGKNKGKNKDESDSGDDSYASDGYENESDDVLANGEVPSQCRIADGAEDDDFADYVEPENFQPVLKEISPEIQQFATEYIQQMLSEFGAEFSNNKLYQNAIQATARLLAESQLNDTETDVANNLEDENVVDAEPSDLGVDVYGGVDTTGLSSVSVLSDDEDAELYDEDAELYDEDEYEYEGEDEDVDEDFFKDDEDSDYF